MEKAKLWFWILFDVLVGVVAIVVLFCLAPALGNWSGSFMPARTITVSAQGETTATPDLAELTFSVVTQGKDPAALSNNNNTSMSGVLAFVSSEGVASSDIKTTSYDLEPNYGSIMVPTTPVNGVMIPARQQTIVGYTLTQTVAVKIHDLTKVASIMGGLAPLGVNQVGGVTFTFNDPDAVTALARTDAMQKAQAKALAMAQAAGSSLGSVTNINESTYFPMMKSYSEGASVSSLAMPAAVSAPISAGTQDITDTVNVTYELK